MSRFKSGEIVVIWWTAAGRPPKPRLYEIIKENTAWRYSRRDREWKIGVATHSLTRTAAGIAECYTVHKDYTALTLEESLELPDLHPGDHQWLLELI